MWEQYLPDEYFEITTNVTSDWRSAYNGELKIKNTSDIVIEDWIIEFDFVHNIDRFYTAEIISYEDNHYVVKNKGYNANIKPGETIILGFNGSPGDVTEEIENVKLGHVLTNIEYLLRDTDGDGLADVIEYELGTDPYKVDTDGDGIDDYTEIMLGLDPLKVDSDDNGVLDGDEDLDGDGLTVLEELEYGTSNLLEDTDGDGLTDYDEIFIYGTDPLVADTDGDGLSDGDEIKLGLDPLKKDSDGDGIPDNEEKIEQILVEEIECEESGQITQVSVSMKGTGLIEDTTKIENTFGKDVLSSELVGLIGVPVDIESTSSFDKATIKFTYDEGLLGKTNEEDLRIMWYDEENNQYVIMDEETVLNTEENTLEITTNHFSTYLVVDRQEWYNAWSNAITYRRDPAAPSIPVEYFDICYVIDRSGSMSGSRITTAKESISKFIDAMYTHDRGAIVGFASSAYVYSQFTGEKKSLNNALKTIYATGGTSVEAGLVSALDLFDSTETKYVNNIPNTKMILLLCDGDVNYSDSTLKRAKDDGIKIFPVLIGATSGNTKLQHMADYTGGTFYYAATAEEIREAIWGIQEETIGDIDTTDTDGDGLYDIYETAGMMLPNGSYVCTDPLKADTDGDGLTDAEEMGVLNKFSQQKPLKKFELRLAGFDSTVYAEYFDYKSDPTKKDTDGDGYDDNVDPRPFISDVTYYSIKDPNYVSIYAPNDPNIDGDYGYGGRQNWFSEENWFSQDYEINNYGCGLIAASDLFLYFALQDSTYENSLTDVAIKNNNIDKADYMDFIRKINKRFIPLSRITGVTGANLAGGMNIYFKHPEMDYRASWSMSLSDKEILSKIEEMLENDIPVILCVGPNTPNMIFGKKGINLYTQRKEGEKDYNDNGDLYQYYINYNRTNEVYQHYMVITEVIKDDVASKHSVMLKVSSWGRSNYIDYDEYRGYIKEVGGTWTSSIIDIKSL